MHRQEAEKLMALDERKSAPHLLLGLLTDMLLSTLDRIEGTMPSLRSRD